jgi:hypothetical protein
MPSAVPGPSCHVEVQSFVAHRQSAKWGKDPWKLVQSRFRATGNGLAVIGHWILGSSVCESTCAILRSRLVNIMAKAAMRTSGSENRETNYEVSDPRLPHRRLRRIGHPVRSAIHKPQIGRLVVGWVTTSEYLLLYVFYFCVFFI